MQGLQTRLKDLEFSGLSGSLIREYQIIYEGDFEVDGEKFSIDQQWLADKHTAATQMLSEGVNIPCPLEHSVDPTNNAAKVIGSRLGLDSKGRPSLYFSCQFEDQETAGKLKSCGVSLWAPATTFTNAATGTSWVSPIRHLAFTRYPRIQDTDASLALSEIVTPVEDPQELEADTMTPEQLKKLAEMIGYEFTDSTTEAEVLEAFDKFDPSKKPEAKPEEKPADKTPAIPPLSEEIVEAREFILSGLTETGKITPAQRDIYKKSAKTMPRADWSNMMEGLKLSSVPTMGGSKTGPQGVDFDGDSGNAMSKAMDKRLGK